MLQGSVFSADYCRARYGPLIGRRHGRSGVLLVNLLLLTCLSSRLQNGKETYQSSQGKFGAADKADVLSAAFLPKDWLVTGSPDGSLLLWDVSTSRAAFGSCCQVRWGVICTWQAH